MNSTVASLCVAFNNRLDLHKIGKRSPWNPIIFPFKQRLILLTVRIGVEVAVSFRATPMVGELRALDLIIECHGKPQAIHCDNGPEYISEKLREWADKRDIALEFIEPSNPPQNAYVERYNRTVRYDWLAQYLFENVIDSAEGVKKSQKKLVTLVLRIVGLAKIERNWVYLVLRQ